MRPAAASLALGMAGLLAACLHQPVPPALPGPLSAGALALSPDGTRLAAVNPDSGTVSLVDTAALAVVAEVATGAEPRTAAFTADGARLLVANHGAQTLSVLDLSPPAAAQTLALGGRPYGVLAGREVAYISLDAPPQVVALDLATLAITARLEVEPFPTGLALSAGGRRLYVSHLYTGRVTVIDPVAGKVLSITGGAAEANLSQFIVLSPDETRAYLPQTYSSSGNTDLAYNTTVQPMVGVLEVAAGGFGEALALAAIDQPVSVPFAAAISPDGHRLYVANAGSDDVAVLDPLTGERIGHTTAGRNPRGLALSADGGRLFVLNALDGTLDVFEAATLQRQATVTLTTLDLPAEVLAGKRLFNSALPPMSRDHWLACAACHLDGGADARTWAGFPDGPRATPALFDAAATLPLHWDGGLDELQDVENTIRNVQFGEGLIAGAAHPNQGPVNAGRSAALDALAAYLATLAAPPSPYAPADAAAAEAVARGERAFRRWGCAACHTAPLFTDRERHPAEFGDPADRFDTPALRGVWASAPYFHDGSAPALRDTLFAQGFHSMGYAMDAREVDDLLAYLRALP